MPSAEFEVRNNVKEICLTRFESIRNVRTDVTGIMRCMLLMMATILYACNTKTVRDNELQEWNSAAIDTLQNILLKQQEWVKVHAAEFLIASGNEEEVKEVFLQELKRHGDQSQYRIGIWRVLTRLSSGEEAAKYEKKIVDAFLDLDGKDRIHAIETMAKLELSPLPDHPRKTKIALMSQEKSLAAYTHWAIAYTNSDSLNSAKQYFLEKLLNEKEERVQRQIAAYVLRHSGRLSEPEWKMLYDMISSLPSDYQNVSSFRSTALLCAPGSMRDSQEYKGMWEAFLFSDLKRNKTSRMDIASVFAVEGEEEHLPLLLEWMLNKDLIGIPEEDADVQASAAFAILKITERLQKLRENDFSERNY